MAKVLATPDSAPLVSLARNVPGAIYRGTLDPSWTMHLIGDEIARITGCPAEAQQVRTVGSWSGAASSRS